MTIQYLSIKQAASYCNKTYEAFRYYIKKMRGPEHTFFDGRLVFTKEALDNWIPKDQRSERKGKGKYS